MLCQLCSSNTVYKKFSLKQFDVLQCKDCNLVFLSQIPTETSLKNLYSSDYYLGREEYYFNNLITNPERGKVTENIESFSAGLKKLNSFKREKGRLLDVGCGLGIFLSMAKMDGWETCGVDISAYAARYAREKFGLEVYSNGRLEEASFPSESFDVITLWDSLEHFSDPLVQFKEIHRILKSDGIIMLDTPNESSLLRVLAKYLYMITGRIFTYPITKLYHQYHLYYYNSVAIETLLRNGGFKIVSTERKTIPIIKARGSFFEKGLVKCLSYLERFLGMEYELLVIAKKIANSNDKKVE